MSYQATLNKLGFYIFAYSEPHTNTHSHDFLELVYITSGKAKHPCVTNANRSCKRVTISL